MLRFKCPPNTCAGRREHPEIFRLLYQEFWRTMENIVNRNHYTLAADWRFTVATWLRCQALISI